MGPAGEEVTGSALVNFAVACTSARHWRLGRIYYPGRGGKEARGVALGPGLGRAGGVAVGVAVGLGVAVGVGVRVGVDIGVGVAQSKDKRPDCFPIDGISLSHRWSRSRWQLHKRDTCSEPGQYRPWNQYRSPYSVPSRSAACHSGRCRCWLSSPRSR
jgi:hypothetical protein